MTFYHVTLKKNLDKILTQGLVSKKERRGLGFESEEGVYLFNSREEAEDAACNWLGDELPEDDVLVLLEVNLPFDWETELDPELPLSASKSNKTIPPQFITVLDENF